MKKLILLFTLLISFIGYSQNKNPQPNYDVKFQNSIKRSVENINLYDYDELWQTIGYVKLISALFRH